MVAVRSGGSSRCGFDLVGETLTFIKRSFCPQVAAATAKALGPGSKAIWSELVAGDSECWEIKGHGYAITRLEEHNGKRTLVIAAAQGKEGIPVLRKLLEIGEANGAEQFRIHSRRPGMGRYLERAGLIFKQELGLGESVFYGRIKEQQQPSI